MTHRQLLTLVAAILGSAVVTIDGSIVNVALPAIERDLGGGLSAQRHKHLLIFRIKGRTRRALFDLDGLVSRDFVEDLEDRSMLGDALGGFFLTGLGLLAASQRFAA